MSPIRIGSLSIEKGLMKLTGYRISDQCVPWWVGWVFHGREKHWDFSWLTSLLHKYPVCGFEKERIRAVKVARRSFILEKTPRQRVRSTRLLGSRKRLTKFDGVMNIEGLISK